jgi:hypothetical protein
MIWIPLWLRGRGDGCRARGLCFVGRGTPPAGFVSFLRKRIFVTGERGFPHRTVGGGDHGGAPLWIEFVGDLLQFEGVAEVRHPLDRLERDL